MGIIVAIILGGLVGWAAARVLGRQEGVLASIVIGVVGSFIGNLISQMFTGTDQSMLALNWSGLLWSFLGALILVAILNATRRPHHV